MNSVDAVWAVGPVDDPAAHEALRAARDYGAERVPLEGGVVLAMNHFSWLDPPAFGTACPRTIHFLAKSEIHSHFGLGQLIRAFGARSVRRGESDREAVRAMREIVREGRRARASSSRGRGRRTACPGRGDARRGDGRPAGGRPGRAGGDLREPVLAAGQLPSGLDRLGRADAFRGHPAHGQGATARARR